MTATMTFRKTVIERRRMYINYDCWLAATEKLSGFQVRVSPYTQDAPLQIDNSFPDLTQRRLMMYVSGGKGNTNYTIELIAQTSEGQTKRDDIGMRVLT